MINPTPRKFRKPNKKTIRNTYENKTNKVSFGIFGIQAIEKGFLTVQQIEAVRKILVKKVKKTGKVWLRAFPDYARTAKPKEVRMGKGKGAVDRWLCIIKPGRIIYEITSRDPFVLTQTLNLAKQKLPFFVRIIKKDLSL